MTNAPSRHAGRPHLRVESAGMTRTYDGDRVLIGREADCQVVVSEPSASRHHAVVQREGDGWIVVDTSSNGTFVRGQRIDRMAVPVNPLSLHVGGPAGEAVVVSLVDVPAPGPASRPVRPPQQPAATSPPPPYQPPSKQPSSPDSEWWRNLPPPQLPAGAAPADAWQPQEVVPPGQLPHNQSVVLPQQVAAGKALTIGRGQDNAVVLDDPLVSRHHAVLQPGGPGQPAVLQDLGSFNGTFVNGRKVEGSAQLAVGAEVIFGNQTFRWDGTQLLASATTHEFTLYADGLTTVLPDGRQLLQHASFKLRPSSLTAVIGPSGAGKSTLLGALTGLRPATHGRVIWQGHDLYAHYDQLRFQIGLVPQQDIQHPQLKVRQALRFAAQLRLPPDTSRPEQDARVHQVADQLQLTSRLDNRIGTQLSGGQKKRVSIATELLTAPPLLFLDEPTSGLDPGLDLEVMKQLRGLADGGRVVMVVTHSVLALDVCDDVMVLAPGGRIAYFGPPSGVLAHFGCASYPEVFDLLDDPNLWQRIPAPAPLAATTGALPPPTAGVPAPPRQSLGRQLSTLVRRNAAVVVSDRLLLGMLLLLPLILGGLSRLVPGSSGLSLDDTRRCPGQTERIGDGMCQAFQGETPVGPPVRMIFDPGEATQRLIVLLVAACLMGTAIAIRELVGERPIFRREYAVGLSPGVYFLSKVLVLGTAAFVQGLLVTFIAVVGLPGADGQLGTLRVAFTIGALAFTMAVVGLALSALVTSTEQTMPTLVGVIMIQLVLSGSLFAIAGRPVLEQVAWLSPSRWGYAACASAMGLVRGQVDREDEDWIALAGAGHYFMDLAVLGFLGAVAFGIGMWLTYRSATED
ncbi:FHA domain-containing protein [Nocardioides bizhenqiangii]|uniref:FHA domain-containing protein n=1 Tax=Nocardioides bizhenqiangii TaxID=3095076 RepID=A0ABZ0ZT46_9ACTN|nr:MULTISPECIES: FHA domain-containing protein [unclassified Nocardioides]MDZ5621862.1 FHA domain-containing protein [Nocardioides sp. HM23]WQQ27455.1 FHA domain-containing protein [Nocardioides sp. HM61]